MRALGIYELYHVHLNSTHSLEHVYEVFHNGGLFVDLLARLVFFGI